LIVKLVYRTIATAMMLGLFVLAGLACGGGDAASKGPRVDLAGVTFSGSPAWTDVGASGMRAANYTYGPVEGDSEAAEVTVFFFGGGQGGDIDANMRRWIGQMQGVDGSRAEGLAKQSTLTNDADLFEHFIEIDGTFLKSSGGPMSKAPKTPMEGWRLVGAIIEAPQGNVFFKLVGPAATVRAVEEDFRTMVLEAERG
jgi:hypothetical protein